MYLLLSTLALIFLPWLLDIPWGGFLVLWLVLFPVLAVMLQLYLRLRRDRLQRQNNATTKS